MLECVVHALRHVNALGVDAMIARRTSFAAETGRQIGTAYALIAGLEKVALVTEKCVTLVDAFA